MSPQPLLLRHSVEALEYGHLAVESVNPELADLARKQIAYWAHCEFALTSLMCVLVPQDFETVAAMFAEVKSGPVRRVVMDVAAGRLSSDQKQVYEDVMDAIEPVEAQRHKFAHWLWAFHPNEPHALLLIDPRILTRFHARTVAVARAHPLGPLNDPTFLDRVFPHLSHRNVEVYRRRELTRLAEHAGLANRAVNLLWLFLDNTFAPAEVRVELDACLVSLRGPQAQSKRKSRKVRP